VSPSAVLGVICRTGNGFHHHKQSPVAMLAVAGNFCRYQNLGCRIDTFFDPGILVAITTIVLPSS